VGLASRLDVRDAVPVERKRRGQVDKEHDYIGENFRRQLSICLRWSSSNVAPLR
jgi:hypothetical protein